MADKDREAFIRWQGRTIEQFSFVSNLLIGLATGVLALEIQAILDEKLKIAADDKILAIGSLIFLGASLLFGLVLAWNRLQDFRKTARVVRGMAENSQEIEVLREEARALGEGSWRLLTLQTGAFALGVGALVCLVLSRVR